MYVSLLSRRREGKDRNAIERHKAQKEGKGVVLSRHWGRAYSFTPRQLLCIGKLRWPEGKKATLKTGRRRGHNLEDGGMRNTHTGELL